MVERLCPFPFVSITYPFMWSKLTLDSKTSLGLAVLLITVIGLALAGKLTPEAVDAIKWLGGSYFGVRAVANYAENRGTKE